MISTSVSIPAEDHDFKRSKHSQDQPGQEERPGGRTTSGFLDASPLAQPITETQNAAQDRPKMAGPGQPCGSEQALVPEGYSGDFHHHLADHRQVDPHVWCETKRARQRWTVFILSASSPRAGKADESSVCREARAEAFPGAEIKVICGR